LHFDGLSEQISSSKNEISNGKYEEELLFQWAKMVTQICE